MSFSREDYFKNRVFEAVRRALPDGAKFEVLYPEAGEHGDYATNAAFGLARTEGKGPMEMAEKIVERLKSQKVEKEKESRKVERLKNTTPTTRMNANDANERRGGGGLFEKIEAVAPGFINFWISDKALLDFLGRVLEDPEGWGMSDEGKGKTVIVEYFQPNIAKIPHIGHLRSAVIGDALKRIFLSQGYRAVSDTHIGDWGTQFGILLCAYKNLNEGERALIEANPFLYLNNLYVEESGKIEEEPERRDRAKEEFAKLERGDGENRKIWRWMADVSMSKILETARDLGLLPFDEHRGESVYEDDMPEIVNLALEKGVAKKLEDGAIVVGLESDGLGEAVLLKSDGASTYLLRDLATISYRAEKWDFWKNIYVVDIRQELHFRQVFRVAELLEIAGKGESEHIEFGFMSLPEGKMSTRKGNTIPLREVLDAVVLRAREIIREKNPDLEGADETARAVGLGALKYFDLSRHRKSNIIFDKEKELSFEGATGPYLQYTYARLQSIMRKILNPKSEIQNKFKIQNSKIAEKERSLLIGIARFPEAIDNALERCAPNILAEHLHKLAQKANEFYHACPVAQEKDDDKRALRVALVQAASLTLKKGLDLLGIEAVEEM